MYDFKEVTTWFDLFLRDTLGFSDFWTLATEFILIGVILLTMYAVLALALIYIERKVCAFFQCRLGPNRVGFQGIFQSVADMIKIMLKEIISVQSIDRFLFNLAPFLVVISSFLAFAILPFGKGMQILDFNVGIFYILAVTSIGVLGILLAGWASNNKYSMIGAMRSGAQMISYELSIGLAFLTVVILSGSMQLSVIVDQQEGLWNIFRGHIPIMLAYVLYLIAGTAETNRGPFDLPEAESELTAGFHTEYSGIHFGFFYLAEFLNMFIVAGFATTLFLGGWQPLHIPGLEGFNEIMDYIPSVVWFFGKTMFNVFIIMWFKWTFPRLRIDQLLALEWKYLMPLGLVNILLMATVVFFGLYF